MFIYLCNFYMIFVIKISFYLFCCSDKVQTLSPIPSAGSLTTVKSAGQTQAVRKTSYTSTNMTRKQSKYY